MKKIKFTKIEEFADILHLTKSGLCRLLYCKRYKTFKIKKKNGGFREINAPKFDLKLIQKWILINILEGNSLANASKAFIKNKNGLKESAIAHKDQKYLLKFDIKDFYPSITFKMVERMFRALGYSDFESSIFTRFCTYKGVLPQGGVTSPYISNLIFKNIDNKIEEICAVKNIVYTRYADDLIFSGNNKQDLQDLKLEIPKLINRHSRFRINKEKTKFLSQINHKKVTGITINNKQIKVSKKIKQDIRITLYNLFKNKCFSKKFSKNRLISNIYFVHLIEDEPQDYTYINKIIAYINQLMQKNNTEEDFGLLRVLRRQH